MEKSHDRRESYGVEVSLYPTMVLTAFRIFTNSGAFFFADRDLSMERWAVIASDD